VTISAELQTRYSTEVDVDWWEAIIISHSRMATRYLANTKEAKSGTIDGAVRSFAAVPFRAVLPKRDGGGDQAMSLQICAVGGEVLSQLDLAIEDPTEPIRVRYTVYIDGDTAPQYDPPLEMAMTDVVCTEQAITATVSRADLINRPVPRVLYRPGAFPGLDRR